MSSQILHITQCADGGVPAVIAHLVADQSARGHRVRVACPAEGLTSGPLGAALAGDHSIDGLVWEADRSPSPSVAAETVRLGSMIAAVRPDVVVLHAAKAGLVGRLAMRGSTPTIYAPHAWSFEAVGGPIGRGSLAWERWASRWTSRLVCVSADELARGRAAGIHGAATVIDNGVDLGRHTVGDRTSARLQLGLADVPTAVCVGRLTRQKGQDRLIDAWRAVREQIPNAQLLLVGGGPDEDVLRAHAGPGVVFVGAQADPRPYMAAANVVVSASRWEGAALVVLEAMACGRSVVATEVAGIHHALAGTGTIVSPDDVGQLSAGVISRLREPSATDADARAARRVAETRHGLDRMMDGWDALVTELAGARSIVDASEWEEIARAS